MKRPLLNRMAYRMAKALDVLAGVEPPQPRRRVRTVFAGARADRNFSDWMASALPAEEEIRQDYMTMKIRARQLSRDNSIVISYLDAHGMGVLGPYGIQFQSEFRGADEELDEPLNDDVEAGFQDWGEHAFVDGMSLEDGEDLLLRSRETDGEILVRMYDSYDNDHGFALQIIDSDQIDEKDSTYGGPGRPEVRMGIEVLPYGKPIAYRIHEDPRRAQGFAYRAERVPAEDIIHLGTRPLRANQPRYVTRFHGIMSDLHLLEEYLESEAVASRNHANSCMGVEDAFEDVAGEADESEQNTEADGSGQVASAASTEISPGSVFHAPPGKKIVTYNPTHPNEAAPDYVRMCERRICAALGVSRIAIVKDASDGNFSSQRILIIGDRDAWRRDQQRWIRTWKNVIARRWFLNALRKRLYPRELFLAGRRPPFAWQTRTFEYTSPLEDAQAKVLMLRHRLITHQAATRELGGDSRDNIEMWAKLQQLADELGVTLEPEEAPAPVVTGEKKNGNGEENGGGATNGAKAKPARAPKSRIGAAAD